MVKLKVEGVSEPSTPESPLISDPLSARHDVACIVVNWSTPDDLKRCIDSAFKIEGPMYWSIFQNHYPELEKENHRAIMGSIAGRSQWTMVQHGKENHGHGYGTNRGAEVAIRWFDPEYLFLVNPDCVWVEPIIDRLVTFMEDHPEAAVVGPKQMDSNSRITAAGILGTMEKPRHRYWRYRDPANKMARDSFQAPTVAGSAMLVRAKVFEELGGLMEGKHYYSETWLNYHAQIHGYEVWYYGDPWMIHEWHRSSPHGSELTDGSMKADREIFREKCDTHNPPIPHD